MAGSWMMRGSASQSALLALALAALHAGARAQEACESFGPLTADFEVPTPSIYDQIWGQVARSNSAIAFGWSSGQDLYVRFFDLGLQPTSGDLLVNQTLNAGNQDEPAICYSKGGNLMVAWSERDGYDGEQMGIYARVYDTQGVPVAPEFEVNVVWQASQWRPLIAATPAGGFVVAWSGDWDGDAFLRVFDQNGTPLTGDVRINTWEWDAQVDPAPAVNRFGTIFTAFIDYSSHGNVGSALNLYGRTFTPDGMPLQAEEFALTSWSSDGDQREPRVAADGLGRFIVVWEDELHDGSGYGVFARRYDNAGNPLEEEFQVNTTTAGDQRACTVVADIDGNFMIAYEDESLGFTRILAQRFDASAQHAGDELRLDDHGSGGSTRPMLAMNRAGDDVLLAYDTPGAGIDVYARRFGSAPGPALYCDAKLNSQGCLPAIDFSGSASASDPTPFWISASNVINNQNGLLLFSLGSSFTPFQGATLCVKLPAGRAGAQNSGGNAGPADCSGTLAFDFNAFIQGGSNPQLAPGVTVSTQYYYRDGQDPTGYLTGLTDALRFTICP